MYGTLHACEDVSSVIVAAVCSKFDAIVHVIVCGVC
jgi:hypothetical protein